jgi:hypothetical protein
MSGIKYDQGKLPMHLLDRTALEAVAGVLQHGAIKYAPENWRSGMEYTRLIGAAMRHLHALNDCEDYDPESGHLHAAHAMCCLMFLIWMMKCRPDLDDRWRGHSIPVPVNPPANAPNIMNEPIDAEMQRMVDILSVKRNADTPEGN